METVLIQINNSKAYKLIEDLEDLNIITYQQKVKNLMKNYQKNMPES